MTQSYTYDGVDIGVDAINLPEGIAGLTQNADGNAAIGGVRIDDPDGTRTFIPLQEFAHEEDACSVPRTFTGFLANMRASRGTYKSGSQRAYDFDLVDLNYLLTLQPLRGASAKRPLESGNDRMAWLMSSIALDGIVFDNGLVGDNPNMFDEADYTGLYAPSVLQDLCVSSSAEVGRIYFVYRDHASGEPSLFIDIPTAATHTSTLRISNDADDVDPLDDPSAVTFAPYRDSELQQSAEEIYCSVFFKYKTGQIYRHNDTTHATYFAGSGYHRQAVFETTRVGSIDTATRHADAFLANHAGTLDTITCTVQLPPSHVNLIEAGHRVQCKFVHFAGFETFGYLRVASRTVVITPNALGYYDVHLTLTNRTITPAGGGGTGDFPTPPAGPPSADEIQAGHTGIILNSLPADDKVILAAIALRNGTPSLGVLPGSWTTIHTAGPIGGANHGLTVGWRLASGESTTNYPSGAGSQVVVAVYPAGTTIGATDFQDDITSSAVDFGGAVAAGPASTVWGFAANVWFFGMAFTPDNDGETVVWNAIDASSNPPGFEAAYKPGAVPGATLAISQVWSGVTVELVGSAEGSPPLSGQWVPPEVVTMTGDTGTTLFPFADGSLQVDHDGFDQTIHIASYDGAAGTFTLDYTPDVGSTITVRYQGR